MRKDRVLTVNLTRRLPDIDRETGIPADLDAFGRCGITGKGDLFLSGVRSSHPSNTAIGFYWALSGDILYISPRGAAVDWTDYITDEFIRYIADKTGIKKRYGKFWIAE